MPNTEDVMGEQELFDAYIGDTLTELVDDRTIQFSGKQLSNMTKLERVIMPNATFGTYTTLVNLPKLEVLSVKNVTARLLYSYGATNIGKLMHLLINQSNASPLTYSSYAPILPSAPVAQGYGAVYVPSSRVATFKANAAWGAYRIEPLENYPVKVDTVGDTWDQIVDASEDGTYASRYQVGDTKELTIDGEKLLMTLVAMDADVLDDDGETTVPMTWVSLPFHAFSAAMDPSVSSAKWDTCYMRSRLESWYMNRIGSDALKSAIKTVRKTYLYQAAYNTSAETRSCGDRLWIPSMREVFSSTSSSADSFETSGPHYGLSQYWYTSEGVWSRTSNGFTGGFRTWYNSDTSSGSQNNNSVVKTVIGFCI